MKYVTGNLFASVLMTIFSTGALALCDCDLNEIEEKTVVYDGADQNSDSFLVLPGEPVRTAVHTAYICHDPLASIGQARLWLPGRALNSAVPILTRVSPGCSRVENLKFLQPGLWELRINGESGAELKFYFGVQR